MAADYAGIAKLVLNRLQQRQGEGDAHDHLTLDTWEWPQGVAVYAMLKLYKASGNAHILQDLQSWYKNIFPAVFRP